MGMRIVEKVRPILRVFGLFLVCMGVCGCSRVRDVANANREELPVEDVLGEMAEVMEEKEEEAKRNAGYEEKWYVDAWIDSWLFGAEEETAREVVRDENAYQIVSTQDGEGEYIALASEDGTCFMRRPSNRTKSSYLESEGAFRFEIPVDWIWGYCELDERLDSFWEEEDVPCLIWGIEDNDMGEDAFSDDWEGVCASVRKTAETVFGKKLSEFAAKKYTLEEGQDVYNFRCAFYDERGYFWVTNAAYRFGEKYMLEFIGIKKGEGDANLENMALYTAATYEEYGGERYLEYEGEGSYKGMGIWDYKKLHNPFVLAYEQANGKEWNGEK